MKYLFLVFVVLILFSCNGGGDPSDCSECEQSLANCEEDNLILKEVNSSLNRQLKDCNELKDSLLDLPPVIVHDTITLVLRDTIYKSDTIYQRDTVCVPGPECDTVMLNYILLYNGDTNWVANTFICCPLKDYQVYTDIFIRGFSTGMHYGEHNYEYACVTVEVNGTDSLIQFGRHICFDLSLEYSGYVTRVLLPRDSIKTIDYIFYNDNIGTWMGEPEDINLYIYGVVVDSMDVFSPEYISTEGHPGWRDNNSYLQLNMNGIFSVNF